MRTHLLLTAVVITFQLASFVVDASADDSRPNIVLIVVDDLGYADLGCTGCVDFDTPHLDHLAASGVNFTCGYVTHPYCSPSRAGILTGRYQQRFGHENNPPHAPDNDAIGLSTEETLLPKLLSNAGYSTAAVGKWHLGDADPFLPTSRGFDDFFGFSSGHLSYYGTSKPNGETMMRGNIAFQGKSSYLTDDFTEEAIEFIKRERNQPFFLFLSYNAVHSPDQAPRKYLDRAKHIEDPFRAVYAAMTIGLDDGIGRVVETLEELGVRKNTLVIFINDNGGRIGSDNRPYRGHKGQLYEGGIRVPFFASWPERLPKGILYDTPVSALDILPTIAAAAEANTASCKPLDGIDLLPYLSGEQTKLPSRSLFWRVSGGDGFAVRDGNWKLIQPAHGGSQLLFDLSTDHREEFNLHADEPEVVSRLMAQYLSWNNELIAPLWTDPHPENVAKEHAAVRDARLKAMPVWERKVLESPIRSAKN